MATPWQTRVALVALGLVQLGCPRPLLTDEVMREDGSGDAETDAETDTPGATGDIRPGDSDSGDASDSGTTFVEPSCHPSYDPCLPVVDDLNCPDVIGLGLAPVQVVGPDAYGLDADNDGIGCEN